MSDKITTVADGVVKGGDVERIATLICLLYKQNVDVVNELEILCLENDVKIEDIINAK